MLGLLSVFSPNSIVKPHPPHFSHLIRTDLWPNFIFRNKWYICLRIGFLCFLLVVIACKLLRYLFRDTSGYIPRGHKVSNKFTPPVGVRDIGSCQPLLCHSFWLFAGRRSVFFHPSQPFLFVSSWL